MQRKRFSDFAAKEVGLEGDKIRISEILNKEIYVLAYRIGQSKAVNGKRCLQIQYEIGEDGKHYISFTNSEVLMRQIQEYEKELPFETIIVKRGSYYTFS